MSACIAVAWMAGAGLVLGPVLLLASVNVPGRRVRLWFAAAVLAFTVGAGSCSAEDRVCAASAP